MTTPLRVAGLFAGVGGIELGLKQAGMETVLLCENEAGAREVLKANFTAELHADIRTLEELPEVDIVTAGFPCQDLSQAGGKRGIAGSQSGLVQHVFRLIEGLRDGRQRSPTVLLENVSYMLRLDRGRAMEYLVTELESLGYRWAYRVIDARAFGVPQRRQRVVMLASTEFDPAPVLLGLDAGAPDRVDEIGSVREDSIYGFYWTEGQRGLGWARDAIPTIKGGSRLGIPSAPAIWDPRADEFSTPSLEDAERLQGFPASWTAPADEVYSRPRRWRWSLVGNAVCVPMFEWVGQAVVDAQRGHGTPAAIGGYERLTGGRWPVAAFGDAHGRFVAPVSHRPVQKEFVGLQEFMKYPSEPLSVRAARGFLRRTGAGRLRFADGFLDSLKSYIATLDAVSEPVPSPVAA